MFMPSDIYGIHFQIRSNTGKMAGNLLVTEIQWTNHEARIALSEVEEKQRQAYTASGGLRRIIKAFKL